MAGRLPQRQLTESIRDALEVGVAVTGAEVSEAALAAGASAGLTGSASTAVQDAYKGLRDALRRRLAGRPEAEGALDAEEVDPNVWQARLGEDIVASGADRDDDVLDSARRLLELIDPGARYTVDAHSASGVEVGDRTVRVGTNYGTTASTMNAPVTINYGQLPNPPARPTTE